MISQKTTRRNEAELLDLHKDMMELIAIRFEEFTDDLLPLFFKKPNQFYIRYLTIDDVLKIKWEWPAMKISKIEEYRFQPCVETEQIFVNRIAAFLYSLLVFIANM